MAVFHHAGLYIVRIFCSCKVEADEGIRSFREAA